MAQEPLTPDQYATGRVVEQDGNEVEVRDSLVAASGNTYLVVGHEGDDISALLPAGTVRDHFNAVDPDEIQKRRDAAAAGTDGTNGTEGGN